MAKPPKNSRCPTRASTTPLGGGFVKEDEPGLPPGRGPRLRPKNRDKTLPESPARLFFGNHRGRARVRRPRSRPVIARASPDATALRTPTVLAWRVDGEDPPTYNPHQEAALRPLQGRPYRLVGRERPSGHAIPTRGGSGRPALKTFSDKGICRFTCRTEAVAAEYVRSHPLIFGHVLPPAHPGRQPGSTPRRPPVRPEELRVTGCSATRPGGVAVGAFLRHHLARSSTTGFSSGVSPSRHPVLPVPRGQARGRPTIAHFPPSGGGPPPLIRWAEGAP